MEYAKKKELKDRMLHANRLFGFWKNYFLGFSIHTFYLDKMNVYFVISLR